MIMIDTELGLFSKLDKYLKENNGRATPYELVEIVEEHGFPVPRRPSLSDEDKASLERRIRYVAPQYAETKDVNQLVADIMDFFEVME